MIQKGILKLKRAPAELKVELKLSSAGLLRMGFTIPLIGFDDIFNSTNGLHPLKVSVTCHYD